MAKFVMKIEGLDSKGVGLISSASSEFDAIVNELLGVPTPDTSAFLRYSVVIQNLTGQTIRGYALRWTCFNRSGDVANTNYQVEQNFDSRQPGSEILAGGARLMSPFGTIYSSSNSVSRSGLWPRPGALGNLPKYAAITVILDAVAFENGDVVGPNEGFALNIWRGMYSAQRDVGMQTIQRARKSSPEDLNQWLASRAEQSETESVDASVQEQLSGVGHWYGVYAKMAAQRLLDFRKNSEEAMLTEADRLANTPVPKLTR